MGLTGQLRVKEGQLLVDALVIGQGIGRSPVQEVDDYPRALDVAQEFVAQTSSGVGSLDQAGDVGHDVASVVAQGHHAQIGLQGSERVSSDLGPGSADHRQQG